MGSAKPSAKTIVERRDVKDACRAATTASIANLAACPVLQDGVTLVKGDRLLVKDSASQDGVAAVSHAHDGIYVVGTVVAGAAPMTRAPDADVSTEVTHGETILVTSGTTNGGKVFFLATLDPIVLGSTALSWSALADNAGQQINQEEHTVAAGEATAGFFVLGSTPAYPKAVRIAAKGGPQQVNAGAVGFSGTADFEVVGTSVKINAASTPTAPLSGDIGSGDVLIIEYET